MQESSGNDESIIAVQEVINDTVESFKDKGLDTPEFQSLSDYADFESAEASLRRSPDSNLFQSRYALIDNDIRKGKNRVVGYKKGYKEAERLRRRIYVAMGGDKIQGIPPDHSVYLDNIKNRIIDNKVK